MSPLTFCQYYHRKECRSCTWIETPYSEQITQKEDRLKQSLSFFPEWPLLPAVRSVETGFRNKAKLSVTGTSVHPVLGLTGYQTGKDQIDQGQELLHCPIHHPRLNELIADLPRWITEYNLIPYRIESHTGELKGVILFYSPQSDEMYLRFVLRSRECVSRIRKLLPALLRRFPRLKSVSANIQPVPHAILEGPEEIFITDQKSIHHLLGSDDFKVGLTLSPQAFVQTNVEVATQLYQAAASWIHEIRPTLMLELFCGQGPFSFFSAKAADRIVGFEINPQAVAMANETARALGFSHLEFRCVNVSSARAEVIDLKADLVLVNPPRKGLGQEGVDLIFNQRPRELIYSSCSVESLERDSRALSQYYRLEKAQVFDLFPHTAHFETLVHFKLTKSHP